MFGLLHGSNMIFWGAPKDAENTSLKGKIQLLPRGPTNVNA